MKTHVMLQWHNTQTVRVNNFLLDHVLTHAATLSFNAIKHMTTGEGGVLLTNDDDLAERARLLRSHGIIRDASKMDDVDDAESPWYYEMHKLGFNYRLSDINCALCLNQVSRLAANIQRRQEIAELYNDCLGDLDIMRLPEITLANGAKHAWHLFARHLILTALGSLAIGSWPNLLTSVLVRKCIHTSVSATLLPPRFLHRNVHCSETCTNLHKFTDVPRPN